MESTKNGRDISINLNYAELLEGGRPTIRVENPKTDWKIWIKTIGVLINDTSPYRVLFRNEQYLLDVKEKQGVICASYSPDLAKQNPLFVKLLKNVLESRLVAFAAENVKQIARLGVLACKGGV